MRRVYRRDCRVAARKRLALKGANFAAIKFLIRDKLPYRDKDVRFTRSLVVVRLCRFGEVNAERRVRSFPASLGVRAGFRALSSGRKPYTCRCRRRRCGMKTPRRLWPSRVTATTLVEREWRFRRRFWHCAALMRFMASIASSNVDALLVWPLIISAKASSRTRADVIESPDRKPFAITPTRHCKPMTYNSNVLSPV